MAEIFLQVKPCQFVQGHLPFSARLLQLMDVFGLRMVLMLRDPRAVAFHMRTGCPSAIIWHRTPSIRSKQRTNRLRLAITGYRIEPEGSAGTGLRARFEHMLPWMEHPAVYTTRFEWLAGPQAGGSSELQLRELRNIAGHLGLKAQ